MEIMAGGASFRQQTDHFGLASGIRSFAGKPTSLSPIFWGQEKTTCRRGLLSCCLVQARLDMIIRSSESISHGRLLENRCLERILDFLVNLACIQAAAIAGEVG